MTNTTLGLGKVYSNATQTVTANSVSYTSSRTYGVQKNASGQLVVNVPWESGGEVDLNEMSYFDYAGRIYGDKYSLLVSAWEHSLTVDPSEISASSTSSTTKGKAQYPNGETEGVIIPQGVTSIGNHAFYGWTSNNQPLVIPDSVTSIGTAAFFQWEANNQPLIIPNSVTSIGGGTFSSWTANNQPLVIPNSVTSIGSAAFMAWTSNNQPLVIPNSVLEIGGYAFDSWTSAKEFIMESETPPTITSDTFNNTNNAPFYVPDESVAAYKANWVDLADRIFPMSDMPSDSILSDRVDTLETSKQDKLVAGDNITIDPNTNVISASGGSPTWSNVSGKPTNLIRQVSFSAGEMTIEVK